MRIPFSTPLDFGCPAARSPGAAGQENAAPGEPAPAPETKTGEKQDAERTALNLLGEVDSEQGEGAATKMCASP